MLTMQKPKPPVLNYARAGLDQKTGTPRFTATLGKLRGENLTEADIDGLLLLEHAMCLLDKANARNLFFHDLKTARFAAGRIAA